MSSHPSQANTPNCHQGEFTEHVSTAKHEKKPFNLLNKLRERGDSNFSYVLSYLTASDLKHLMWTHKELIELSNGELNRLWHFISSALDPAKTYRNKDIKFNPYNRACTDNQELDNDEDKLANARADYSSAIRRAMHYKNQYLVSHFNRAYKSCNEEGLKSLEAVIVLNPSVVHSIEFDTTIWKDFLDSDLDKLKTYFSLIPKRHQFSFLKENNNLFSAILALQYVMDPSVFELLNLTPETLEYIFSLIPSNQRLSYLKGGLPFVHSTLSVLRRVPTLLEAALKALPEYHRLYALTEPSEYRTSFIASISDNFSLLMLALKTIPKNDRSNIIEDLLNPRFFSTLRSDPEHLLQFLDLFPQDSRLDLLCYSDPDLNDSIFTHFVDDPPLFLRMMNSLTQTQKDRILTYRNNLGESLLEGCATQPEKINAILRAFSQSSLIDALKLKGPNGQSTLEIYLNNPESLILMMSLFDESRQLDVLKEEFGDNLTLLSLAFHNPQTLSYLLSLYSETKKNELLMMKNNENKTLLDLAKEHPSCLPTVLSLYPESTRLNTLQDIIPELNDESFADDFLLEQLLAQLPEDSRYLLLSFCYQNNKFVLHKLIDSGMAFSHVLNLIPQHDHLQTLLLSNVTYGDTVLHHLAYYECWSFAAALATLTSEEKLYILSVQNLNGSTVIKDYLDFNYHIRSHDPSERYIICPLLSKLDHSTLNTLIWREPFIFHHLAPDHLSKLTLFFTFILSDMVTSSIERPTFALSMFAAGLFLAHLFRGGFDNQIREVEDFSRSLFPY